METTLKVEQLYTGCLAHGAYYIESNGEAAVIDPLRDPYQYLHLAEQRKARIRYVFETHFHADFVSGHIDLARATGAEIVYGPTSAATGFAFTAAADGQVFRLGNVSIKVLHTPGHTPESSCFLLIDETGKEKALFTGDTLFIGDVGRPDLAQHVNADLDPQKLAASLYDSLHGKIMPLPDDVVIYPGHGAGSACGKNMSKETVDTLGHQKQVNPALRPGLGKAQFIQELLTGLTPPPAYFPKNVLMNIKGYEQIDAVIKRSVQPVDAKTCACLAEAGALVVDTRAAGDFARGFIPGSVNIGLDGNFASWVGTVIADINQKIVLVTEPGREEEAALRLTRVGYDGAIGYLEGGVEAWKTSGQPLDTVESISAGAFAALADKNPGITIVDVRKKSEFDAEHVLGALNHPLDYINTTRPVTDAGQKAYVHCAGGYRSMVYISMLRRQGYRNLVNVEGGFTAMKQSGGFRLSEYVCPTTML